jgi:hypothetical protein
VRVTDGGRLWATVLRVVEAELGQPVDQTTLHDRRRLVALLADAGAFELRYGVALSAELLGVSRYTVYGDLRRLEEGSARPQGPPRPADAAPDGTDRLQASRRRPRERGTTTGAHI